jgi:tetratricopeptide (TPR) repeat protein
VKIVIRKSSPLAALSALSVCLVANAGAQTAPQPAPATPAEVHARRAAAHRVRGDLALAISEYDKAIQAEPNAAEIYARRGGARRANGDAEGALEDFDRAYSLDPRSVENDRGVADAFSSRGFVRAARLDLSGALADFDKAIACYQGNPDFYFKRGQARLIKGDTAGAISDVDAGLALRPGDKLASIAYAVRGYAHVLRGEEEDARRDFAESVRLNRAGKFFLHMHLRTLESQVDEYKQLRARDDQRITE